MPLTVIFCQRLNGGDKNPGWVMNIFRQTHLLESHVSGLMVKREVTEEGEVEDNKHIFISSIHYDIVYSIQGEKLPQVDSCKRNNIFIVTIIIFTSSPLPFHFTSTFAVLCQIISCI